MTDDSPDSPGSTSTLPLGQVEDICKHAIRQLVCNDSFLLKNQVHEQAISHRFAVYLERKITVKVLRKLKCSVDCEYNRHGTNDKLYPAEAIPILEERARKRDVNLQGTFRPDVIVHQRGNDTRNVLLVEWKVSPSRPDRACVRERLKWLMAVPTYHYQYGLACESLPESVKVSGYVHDGSSDLQRVFFHTEAF